MWSAAGVRRVAHAGATRNARSPTELLDETRRTLCSMLGSNGA
jgi:hypothetical protein